MTTHNQKAAPFCVYPPRIADHVDVTEQTEAGIPRYLIRNTLSGRYFRLKLPDYQIFRQIDGTQTLDEISNGCRGTAPRVAIEVLRRFLAKLDSLDLIARGGDYTTASPSSRGLYTRIKLFNPNPLLTWLDNRIGWALNGPAITASTVLMFLVVLGLLVRADEVASYTGYTLLEYGLAAVLLTTVTITVIHEFAHGLACRHFGGDVQEMGFLMIYYVLPAFYCNVTDMYRVADRRQRLWIIFAGIYWQLLVSAVAGFVWLLATPFTLLADLAFVVLLGGTLNILINCNPLIKLDGYYALCQLVGVQNLRTRSSDYVQLLARRAAGLEQGSASGPCASGGHTFLFVSYWFCSVIYSVILTWLILTWVGPFLMDWFGLLGVIVTLFLAALLTERWWKPVLAHGSANLARAVKGTIAFLMSEVRIGRAAARKRLDRSEGGLNMSAQAVKEEMPGTTQQTVSRARWLPRRATAIKCAAAIIVVAVLVAPWEASTGSDCALLLPPGREGIARANTDAVIAQIFVQAGDAVREGARIARLANPELEDRLTQLGAEIARLDTNASRIEEELRVRSEMLLSASLNEQERKRLAEELKQEASQIAGSGYASGLAPKSSNATPESSDAVAQRLPAALAVLQSEIELKETELKHNRTEVQRYRTLYDQGLVGGQLYDRAVAAMRISETELQRARARLEASMVDHRRLTSGAQTGSLVAETEARAARSNFEALIAELHSNRQQLESLRQRREILQREYEGMNVVAPRSGVVLGEDLHKVVGRRYSRGEEICRIGELERFLLRIDVNEREIADVRLDSPVRFKLKTVPGRTFTGVVSKINAEPVPNELGQMFYPVEVMVENSEGMLRPGMTGFARISFGRQSVGLILADKVRHALRPELWLF